jgi:hypothetical protein
MFYSIIAYPIKKNLRVKCNKHERRIITDKGATANYPQNISKNKSWLHIPNQVEA